MARLEALPAELLNRIYAYVLAEELVSMPATLETMLRTGPFSPYLIKQAWYTPEAFVSFSIGILATYLLGEHHLELRSTRSRSTCELRRALVSANTLPWREDALAVYHDHLYLPSLDLAIGAHAATFWSRDWAAAKRLNTRMTRVEPLAVNRSRKQRSREPRRRRQPGGASREAHSSAAVGHGLEA